MSLMCSWDIGDGPSVFSSRIVKAKKPHQCRECGKTIEIGEEYEYVFGVWGGSPDQIHTCEKCADLASSLIALGFCYSYGDLWAAHAEYIAHYAQPHTQHRNNRHSWYRGV